MSFMKKYIISLTILFVLTLTSCQKEIKFYAYVDDYNLINQDLEILVYTNMYNSPYLDIENVVNAFLYDDNNKLPLELKDIKYLGYYNKKHQFTFLFNTTNYKNEMIVFTKPTIEIEYINQLTINLKLNSLCIYNFDNNEYYNDLNVIRINGVFDEYLKCINIDLKNNGFEIIQIKDIKLINAYFGADLRNLSYTCEKNTFVEERMNIYNPHIKETKLQENIVILSGQTIHLTIPICYRNVILGNQSAIIIEYEINNIIRNKVIYNFVFANNKNVTLGVYDVTN